MRALVLGAGGADSEEEAAQGQYETRLLEQSIYKICALLAVGFGDAGAEVIAENIKKEGDLNPIVPGKKMVAVFGFCDIRRFTDTTEVLQEGVMEFVNTIAHLVHGAVAARGGAANKNIGDAFLLVWKLPKGLDERDNVKTLPALSTAAKTTIINTITDNALASFVVIQVAVSVSRLLGRYARRPDLNARMPGFRVQMGFGLHVGWAIEGAIGSEYKIDASYLSPNVNLASRLEAATKQYDCPLLLSRDFVDCLSPAVRAKVRQVDCVTLLLSQEYDDDWLDNPVVGGSWGLTWSFKEQWDDAMQLYLSGDWPAARHAFEGCLAARTNAAGQHVNDGPSATLLDVMAGHDFRAPPGWKGVRELTEK
ncbi:nucleotide cyclase [Scenedesmus sp. NREL 46B-D3]|nr:nucleotide cyclase [Scenedesmus sp. NREL 46B-D3]